MQTEVVKYLTDVACLTCSSDTAQRSLSATVDYIPCYLKMLGFNEASKQNALSVLLQWWRSKRCHKCLLRKDDYLSDRLMTLIDRCLFTRWRCLAEMERWGACCIIDLRILPCIARVLLLALTRLHRLLQSWPITEPAGFHDPYLEVKVMLTIQKHSTYKHPNIVGREIIYGWCVL